MNATPTSFNGLVILQPKVLGDARGYFMETYNGRVFEHLGLSMKFVQDNQSLSTKGVLRGLHFQNAPYSQTKLVRVLSGKILDVVVDLRKTEKTFGQVFTIELSAENKKQLLVPKGFAHGFAVLSEQAEILYKCDDFYNPQAEGGINFFDPALGLDTELKSLLGTETLLSKKDQEYPGIKDANFNF